MQHSGNKPTPWRRLALAAVAVMAAAAPCLAVPGTAAAAQTAPAGARPGDLISAEPSLFRVVPGLPTLTRAWKILYRSTDVNGNPDQVSGTVIVPDDGRTGTRPLLTYAVGTVGLADQCAPSANFPKGTSIEAGEINAALQRGWAVAVTDYQGLGTPGDHTYLVGRPEGTAVLDAARAAQRLPQAQQAGVTADSPVGVMGYSQGGHASAWAAELARTYAPDLHIKGIASGGVPADELKSANAGGGIVGLELLVAIGHDAAYPELNLDGYLTDEGRDVVTKLRGGCILDDALATIGKSLDELTVRNPIESPDWQKRLAADKLGTRAPGYPVYLYHGTSDEVVSYDLGEQLRADWCSRGNVVQWQPIPLANHAAGAIAGAAPAMDWLAARIAGQPTQGNCS
ncbi:lipase family protein [Actinomadura violacea]|uniref:Triacylglycerol lipase n=1 Tax=Actinomadura violacea TaxID=2819934 RepID=A0ABS3RN02_9ACTN|nr:lipase family protein [Actinomadura violacea]MBO2458081.1 triacylglycerol lipase [Actinomadura violacea]